MNNDQRSPFLVSLEVVALGTPPPDSMKLLQIFVFASLASSLAGASTFELKPGEPFPKIPLPQAAGGDLMSIANFRGEKLMLHLFASW